MKKFEHGQSDSKNEKSYLEYATSWESSHDTILRKRKKKRKKFNFQKDLPPPNRTNPAKKDSTRARHTRACLRID